MGRLLCLCIPMLYFTSCLPCVQTLDIMQIKITKLIQVLWYMFQINLNASSVWLHILPWALKISKISWTQECLVDCLDHQTFEQKSNSYKFLHLHTKHTSESRQTLSMQGWRRRAIYALLKQKPYNFNTNTLKAYLSNQPSFLSLFMISKTHISAQQPR